MADIRPPLSHASRRRDAAYRRLPGEPLLASCASHARTHVRCWHWVFRQLPRAPDSRHLGFLIRNAPSRHVTSPRRVRALPSRLPARQRWPTMRHSHCQG
ncbi:putative uncharacterized protein [Xanthomonas citri pv. mangiferaeindicae LMG 941]|nr:putative uncharacterized protein [Xanthomonas citri pv. mangiferaeindicae LMG 941]